MILPGSDTDFITIEAEDRYHRQRLIPWWDQTRVAEARVLVVGAGALGNEILKLLALTGVGQTLIYDMDTIEGSNLSRTVLFRQCDEKAWKAEVAAQRMRELNPDVQAVGHAQNVMHDAGLGIFLWADIVICGLDNRLARQFVNTACALTGKTWIDGAIEDLSGIIRVFDPARTACYECTMNETDRRQIQERLSCAMLARNAVARGHVPTTAVAGSIIAALEVQEAIKFLHEQPTLAGEGLHINGLWGDFTRVLYQRRDDCPSHDRFEHIYLLGVGVKEITLSQLLRRAEEALGEGATLDLSRDLITQLTCHKCQQSERVGVALGALSETDATCKVCRSHRIVEFTGSIWGDGVVDLSLTPAEIGVPEFDIITFRRGLEARQSWLFDADAQTVLGPMASNFDLTVLSTKLSKES